MKAFVLAVLGWVFILFDRVVGSDGIMAGDLVPCFFFLAALVSLILGIGRRQQRGWNMAALILLLPPLLAVAALFLGGVILGS